MGRSPVPSVRLRTIRRWVGVVGIVVGALSISVLSCSLGMDRSIVESIWVLEALSPCMRAAVYGARCIIIESVAIVVSIVVSVIVVVARTLKLTLVVVVRTITSAAAVHGFIPTLGFVRKFSFLLEEVNQVDNVGVVQSVSAFESLLPDRWHGFENNFFCFCFVNVDNITRVTRKQAQVGYKGFDPETEGLNRHGLGSSDLTEVIHLPVDSVGRHKHSFPDANALGKSRCCLISTEREPSCGYIPIAAGYSFHG